MKNLIKNKYVKKVLLFMLQAPMRPRPRWWVKTLVNPFFHNKGRKSFISENTRMDIFPYNSFNLGKWSTIEDWSCVNNALGNVIIGNYSRIGLSNTIIGPVEIGNNVNIAQHVVISGLNHGYEEIQLAPRLQKCSTKKVIINDDCWIGANVVITPGVELGKHCIVAAGSVVTKSAEPYSLLAGNPAKVIKYYDFELAKWVKNNNQLSYGKAV